MFGFMIMCVGCGSWSVKIYFWRRSCVVGVGERVCGLRGRFVVLRRCVVCGSSWMS